MIFFDTESAGKTGPLLTVQWSIYHEFDPYGSKVSLEDEDSIVIHYVWDEPVKVTLKLMESLTKHLSGIVGFNLTHDWFVINKWYNVFRQVKNKELPPIPEEVLAIERAGPQPDDVCLKPVKACDLLLLARAGKYQYLAKHKPIKVKKVPVQVVDSLISHLNGIKMPVGVTCKWRITRQLRETRKDVVDIVGEFSGLSRELKHLAAIILNDPTISNQTFDKEVARYDRGRLLDGMGRILFVDQPDWMPWGADWLRGLQYLRSRFATSRAQQYARKDVYYTYKVWDALGRPPGGDDDSELACLVGATQWRGFAFDVARAEELLKKYEAEYNQYVGEHGSPNSQQQALREIYKYLSDIDKLIVTDTKKTTLEELARWNDHPVQPFIKKLQSARRAGKRSILLRQLIQAGRFTFSMKVLGTLSSRMSGGSEQQTQGTKLNSQGIPREKEFRALFPLAFNDEHLEGGDFDAFEVTILDAVYNDEQLHKDLLGPTKIHAIAGASFYNTTPEEIQKTKGTLEDKYTRSKNAFFGGVCYGAQIPKIAKTLDLPEPETEEGFNRISKRYPGIPAHKKRMASRFTPITQPEGVGTAIIWNDPNDYIESILGFRRYFTLEWSVIRGLYDLSTQPPPEGVEIRGECRRTNRRQTIAGACSSALYAAIFALQSHVLRAAINHEIQSPGAQITKHVQRRVWDLQPSGINRWFVRPFNVHDEVLCPCLSDCAKLVQHNLAQPSMPNTHYMNTLKENKNQQENGQTVHGVVQNVIQELRKKIPLLKMDWKTNLKSWGDKT